jgi:hypothetical protein
VHPPAMLARRGGEGDRHNTLGQQCRGRRTAAGRARRPSQCRACEPAGAHHGRLRRVLVPDRGRVVRPGSAAPRVAAAAAAAARPSGRRDKARVRQHARKLAPHVGQHLQRLAGQDVLLGECARAAAPALPVKCQSWLIDSC